MPRPIDLYAYLLWLRAYADCVRERRQVSTI